MIDRDALIRLIQKHPLEAPPPDLGREKRSQAWKEHTKHWRPKVSKGVPSHLSQPYWEAHE